MDADRTFFVTAVTYQRRTLFQNDASARLFLETLYHYRAQSRYLLHEFVVMPDHFHLLITPAPTISLERAMQFIKGGFSHAAATRFSIWQPSFTNHRIRDAEDYQRHRIYILMNPVRKRLATLPEDYPYSSAHQGFELDPAPLGLKPELWATATPA